MIKCYVGNNMHREAKNVPSDTTPRQLLEEAQIDYNVGMTSLNGATLKPEDLDKTLAELNAPETCYLINTAKAQNAATAKIVGRTAVIESSFTPDQLRMIAKYRPKALQIVDHDTSEPKFAICVASGKGSINNNGVEYGAVAGNNGKAFVQIDIPAGVDGAAYLEEKTGVAFLNLKQVESGLAEKLSEIEAQKAEVLAAIESV